MKTQRGFTLIEMMVALLIGTLLVIMILSIFSRMSFAYREQQQIVTVQQALAAARNVIELDAKQAGLEMSQGFKLANDGMLHSPIRVVNSSTGPDEVGFYYADPSAQALITSPSAPAVAVTVDNATGFAVNDLVVLSTADTLAMSNPIAPTTDAKITKFDACVVKIDQIVGNAITFSEAAPWGNAGNTHCTAPAQNSTMMYKFVAHYWRIDPSTTGTRQADGVLQLDTLGNIVGQNQWIDEAYGFTDLQVATYFFDGDASDTNDPDTDPMRDWSSSGTQQTYTDPTAITNTFTPPLMMTFSLVSRTDSDVEGIYTTKTPQLVDTANVANNTIGDHDIVDLTTTPDPHLTGKRIYRYITFQVDLRNMGVGR